MPDPVAVEKILDPNELDALRRGFDEVLLSRVLEGFLPSIYQPIAGYSTAIMDAFYRSDRPADDGPTGRQRLSAEDRERCVVALLAARDETFTLKVHIYYALMLGISPGELANIVWLAGIYSGVGSATNGLKVLKETLEGFSALAKAGKTSTQDIIAALQQ